MSYTLLPGDNIKVLADLQADSVDLTITSPPYNLDDNQWDMGGKGRRKRDGIEYDSHGDNMAQAEYEEWQRAVLAAAYRVTKPGGSLFYNHKPRTLDGELIHPLRWLTGGPWKIRQEIIWDRKSTHNHEPRLFWPVDERIFWLTKGKPTLEGVNIRLPSVWSEFGPVPNTWHPAPFPLALPRMLLKAMNAGSGMTVLDPFAGSCTTIKAALECGCDAIGIDVSQRYLETARREIENQPVRLTGDPLDYAGAPLFAGLAVAA